MREFIYDVLKGESSVSNLRITCTHRKSGIAKSRLTVYLAAGQTVLELKWKCIIQSALNNLNEIRAKNYFKKLGW